MQSMKDHKYLAYALLGSMVVGVVISGARDLVFSGG